MNIKIGKADDNDYIVDNPHVSRHHALLSLGNNGEYTLQDLGSANGTFVNGQQILRKNIVLEDKIILGGKVEISLQSLLDIRSDFSKDFEALKPIYTNYQSEKVRIQSSNQFKTRLFQSLPFALPGILGLTYGFIGSENKNIFYLSLSITIIGPVVGIFLGAKQAAKVPAQLQILTDTFKTNYVCPKCGFFLGEIPWQSIKNRGKCGHTPCKARW
ncbi:hypothetical protein AwDysgo_08040 [Bacteroidales bacterium]|nr:hypothetical protein AwDysgo_08040 [Bacteroidales bacterium]